MTRLFLTFLLVVFVGSARGETEGALLENSRRAFERGDFDGAISYCTAALQANPKLPAVIYTNRGIAYVRKNNREMAISDFDEAIRVDPKNARAYFNRAYVRGDEGKHREALNDYNEAIRCDAAYASAYYNRGETYLEMHAYRPALQDFRKAIQLAPQDGDAHNELAWLLATCPNESLRDGKAALRHARAACDITKWREWTLIDTLAAAHAEVGDFGQATKFQEQALIMHAPAKDRKAMAARLRLYKQRLPYHNVPRARTRASG